jgi:hypothetical protein
MPLQAYPPGFGVGRLTEERQSITAWIPVRCLLAFRFGHASEDIFKLHDGRHLVISGGAESRQHEPMHCPSLSETEFAQGDAWINIGYELPVRSLFVAEIEARLLALVCIERLQEGGGLGAECAGAWSVARVVEEHERGSCSQHCEGGDEEETFHGRPARYLEILGLPDSYSSESS